MQSRALIGALAISGMLGCWSQAARAITLVQDGQPKASIVIRDSAFKAEPYTPHYAKAVLDQPDNKVRRAADDLQTYIRKISGATLPIVSDAQPVAGPVVLVGLSPRVDEMHLAIPHGVTREKNEEGYVIDSRGDTLVLAGNEDGPYWGTYYAVAEFLNRLGVRWFMPGDFGEVIPHTTTINYSDGKFVDHPDFRERVWTGYAPYDLLDQEYLWKLRNKMMIELTWPNCGDSSIRQWLPPESEAKTHPEYFAKNLDGSLNTGFPNLTNPDMPGIMAAKMAAYLDDYKKQHGVDADGISCSPDDGAPSDFRPESRLLSQNFTETVGRVGEPTELSNSEEWFTFMNKVADELEKTHPNTIIGTNGYSLRQMPPEGVKLNPNFLILYASIWADTLKAFDNPRSWHGALQAAILKRWGQMASRIDCYRYVYSMLTDSLTPIPQTRKLAHDMPLYKKDGISGFQDEQKSCSWMAEGIPTYYLRARTEWNANLDINASLNDYFQKWYGPAAVPAKAFWDALEQNIETMPYLGHEDRILQNAYSPELLATLEARVKEEEAAAADEPFKTHVAIDRHILEHLKAYVAMMHAEADANYKDAIVHLDKMQEERAALHAISGFLNQPETGYDSGYARYYSGTWAYGLISRRPYYQKVADLMDGKSGTLVAMGDRNTKFALDPADVGKTLRWYDPDFDRSGWRTIDTTKSYYSQGYLSPEGVPYEGLMWYVFDINVPRDFVGKPVRLYTQTVVDEAWVWANGEYVGHRPYNEGYTRPSPLDFDVTNLVHPGHNIIAIRVSTSTNRTQAADGMQSRLFLWSPNPGAKAPLAYE